MHFKKKAHPIAIIFLIFAIIIGITTYLVGTNSNSKALTFEPTGDPFQDDALYLVNLIETSHPAFIKGQPEGYAEAKDLFLNQAKGELSDSTFKFMVNTFLTSLHDGHTQLSWYVGKQLDIEWQYSKGHLYLLDEVGRLTDQRITAIGGVSDKDLFTIIDQLVPAENESALLLNYENYANGERVLEYANAQISDSALVELTDNSGNSILKEYPFVNKSNKDWQNNRVSTKTLNSNTLLITMGICEENQELDQAISTLKNSMNNGTKRVIVDLRNNPGGNSNACTQLLDAMGKRGGSYGCTIRYSPLAKDQRGYSQSKGYETYDNDPSTAVNSDIELFVITNERTFSSATMMATWTRDGGLGKIVGQPSSNSPNSYGDVLYFTLPNTKFEGSLSHKQFIRPAGLGNKETSIIPDFLLDSQEDPIAFILKL